MFSYVETNLACEQNLKEDLFSDKEWQDLTFWYLNKEQETVLLLKDALANQDFDKIISLGDQIYGHGGSFGFARISSFGKKIELAAISKDTILLSCLISSLKIYLQYLLRNSYSQLLYKAS